MPIAPLPSGRRMSYLPMRPASVWPAAGFGSASLMGPFPCGRAPRGSGSPGPRGLPGDGEVHPPVARPAILRLVLADRDLLAVGDGLQPVARHSQRHEVVVGRPGAPLPQ